MRGALVAFPTLAIAQFRRFFDCGRAIRCMLPPGGGRFMNPGRFMHLVVLYGYQGADTDAEQVALTEQLFDAALGELGVSAGLWVDLEAAWALACGTQPAFICKRT